MSFCDKVSYTLFISRFYRRYFDMQTVDRIPLLKRPFKLLTATTTHKDQASDRYDEKDIVTSCSETVTEARNERRAAISLSGHPAQRVRGPSPTRVMGGYSAVV